MLIKLVICWQPILGLLISASCFVELTSKSRKTCWVKPKGQSETSGALEIALHLLVMSVLLSSLLSGHVKTIVLQMLLSDV